MELVETNYPIGFRRFTNFVSNDGDFVEFQQEISGTFGLKVIPVHDLNRFREQLQKRV